MKNVRKQFLSFIKVLITFVKHCQGLSSFPRDFHSIVAEMCQEALDIVVLVAI